MLYFLSVKCAQTAPYQSLFAASLPLAGVKSLRTGARFGTGRGEFLEGSLAEEILADSQASSAADSLCSSEGCQESVLHHTHRQQKLARGLPQC